MHWYGCLLIMWKLCVLDFFLAAKPLQQCEYIKSLLQILLQINVPLKMSLYKILSFSVGIVRCLCVFHQAHHPPNPSPQQQQQKRREENPLGSALKHGLQYLVFSQQSRQSFSQKRTLWSRTFTIHKQTVCVCVRTYRSEKKDVAWSVVLWLCKN